MKPTAAERALDFIENEKQFHLGFLPTEQSNPLTKNLSRDYAEDPRKGVATLQRVDRCVLAMAKRVFAGPEFAEFAETLFGTVRNGGKIVFSGCGATGRLSILLECMWRDCCAKKIVAPEYADRVASIMTGGDFALVRSVEFFEDYHEFGRQQVRGLGMGPSDTLVAITEGGETSSVLGTVDQALKNGAKVFLMFNNPAKLLAERLERSRAAIMDPRVRVLDLFCGPMALAGSTRMQATTSEQLVAGGALETAACRLAGLEPPDYAAEFEKLLDALETPRAVEGIAEYTAFEAEIYRKHGKVTYFADAFLLDIFTDTTERSPTFMLPPFRGNDDTVSPLPWAFVKNPLCSTREVWENGMHRPLRCLTWDSALLAELGAPENIVREPPRIGEADLLKFEVGNEHPEERCRTGCDAAVLVKVSAENDDFSALEKAFAALSAPFAEKRVLSVGRGADCSVPCDFRHTPLDLMVHMAVKLVLNTVSTGTMAILGRIEGNWMSWVDCTNKKLLDRGTRLVCEIGGLDYRSACVRIFEALDAIAESNAKRLPGEEKQSAVQVVLGNLAKR